jgi:hypothetical protein
MNKKKILIKTKKKKNPTMVVKLDYLPNKEEVWSATRAPKQKKTLFQFPSRILVKRQVSKVVSYGLFSSHESHMIAYAT